MRERLQNHHTPVRIRSAPSLESLRFRPESGLVSEGRSGSKWQAKAADPGCFARPLPADGQRAARRFDRDGAAS